MTQLADARDVYRSHFDAFEKRLNGASGSPFHAIRRKALESFSEHGFPTMREEDWKYTNLAPLMKVPFRQPDLPEADTSGSEALARGLAGAGRANQLVFVNGRFVPAPGSPLPAGRGAVIGNLGAAFESHREVIADHLARHASYENLPLVALNTAFTRDGAFIYIPDGVILEEPIHLLFVSAAPGVPTVSHPRNLVVAGRNSQAAIIETYLGPESDTYFTNAVTEIVTADGAIIDHYRVQQEGKKAFHTGNITAHQGRNSTLKSCLVSLGGALVRNDLFVLLDGEGSGCDLNGLYMADDRQHVDNHTVIDHAKPHCSSNEYYKGILGGHARAVFNGEIIVRPDAQKTDAHQLNKNLVLSEDALINTKPRLRIHANDVKCTHGATVGMLDRDSLFYLRSRGFPQEEAQNMLTYAFAAEVLEPIKEETLRLEIERLVISRVPGGERLRELA